MVRTILHVDLNNFYASVECILNPALKGKNVGVCGSIENRHGIILAKSEGAKKLGVKTGMVIKDAIKLCPDLVLVKANHKNYITYSNIVRNIYKKYSDKIEAFGIDECWIDCTASIKMFGSGEEIANKIRNEVREKTGLTVSVGVSFNKVFSKLGSDLKKPDGTTVISYENFKEIVWKLPISNLLFVGKHTTEKFNKINVKTIGDLAQINTDYLIKKFGKWGTTLQDYALGKDDSEVLIDDEIDVVKSVGNSMTSYRDIVTFDDALIMFNVLAESVSTRLIDLNVGKASTLSIYVRFSNLESFTRQCKLKTPSNLTEDFKNTAFELFKKEFKGNFIIRTLGISVSNFQSQEQQISIDDENYQKKSKLNSAIMSIKSKYGVDSVQKGILLRDKKLLKEDPKNDNAIHPQGHI